MIVKRSEVTDNDGTYIECIFHSSNILKTIYFTHKNKLYISFNRGHTYSYSNIDREEYDEFEKSESQGKTFYKKWINNSKYPYYKEFSLNNYEIEEAKKIIEEWKNNQ